MFIFKVTKDQITRLFVYGIGENVARDELEQEFGHCGSVTDAYNTGMGYVCITFSSPDEAQNCIQQMNGQGSSSL